MSVGGKVTSRFNDLVVKVETTVNVVEVEVTVTVKVTICRFIEV